MAREELWEGDSHEVDPHRGKSLGAGGTVDLGVWVDNKSGDGSEGGVSVDRDDADQGGGHAHGTGLAAPGGAWSGELLWRDQGEAGLVEGGQEISVVARGLEKNFGAGYRAGYGVQERDNGGSGAACGDGGEGSGEELGLDGSLDGGGIPELGGGEDDVKGRETVTKSPVAAQFGVTRSPVAAQFGGCGCAP